MRALRDGTLIARPIAAALLVLALLLRVFVPSGWMPAQAADGATRIVICSEEGRQAAWVDRTGKLHRGDPHQPASADHPCAFAGLAMASDIPELPTLPPLAFGREEITPRGAANVAVGRGLAAPPPPATGPPLLG